MLGVAGVFILTVAALSAPFGMVTRDAERADQGFFRDRTGRWHYAGEPVLNGWQVHLTIEGRRIVCESPTVYETEVILCDKVILVDEAIPAAPEPKPKKTAYDGPIPKPFIPSPEPAYDLEARIDRIYAGLEPER